jgi:hypothetical protein
MLVPVVSMYGFFGIFVDDAVVHIRAYAPASRT